MPRSATGRATEGLTLIELVVVVAILGLLALPVMMRFGGGGAFGGQPPAARVVAALEADLAHLRDQALLGRQVLALAPRETGWSGGSSRSAEVEGLRLVWRIEAPASAEPPARGEPPPVRILPDGRATPFELRIEAAGAAPVNCRFDGWEGLTCAPR